MQSNEDYDRMRWEALRQVGLEITAQLDLDTLLQSIVSRATELLQGTAGGLHVYRPDDVLEWTVATGNSRAPLGTLLRRGEGVAGQVLATNQPVILGKNQSLPADTSLSPIPPSMSVVAVPVRWEPEFLGVLHVLATPPRDFSEEDAQLLSMFATHAAIAMRNAQLVHRLQENERELRLYASELQARNEELDAFSHTVAHDLKAPLANLMVYAQILEEGFPTMSAEEVAQGTRTICRNVRKINNIIEELLLLASVRKVEVELELLDMSSIVKEALRRVKDMVDENHAELVIPDSWPPALGYGPWVEEVWVNYLSNGLKYGGDPPRLTLGSTVEDGMICFWVSDNGPGLTAEQQAELFKPFTQLGQVRTKGHGLGLSIVQRIVEKLDGKVGVESQGIPGRGSRFYFLLPMDPGYSKAGR